MAAPLTPDHPFVRKVVSALRHVYADKLVSVALFGSVARRMARPDSDLDLFVVVEGLPHGRRARLSTFEPVERALARDIEALAQDGVTGELSPVLRTPGEIRTATPLMLDLTEDVVILEDRGGILRAALDDLSARLHRLGSRRIWVGTSWYWDLKPDYRRSEIFRL
jgi:hypothetical protein